MTISSPPVLLADFQFLTRQGIAAMISDLDDFHIVGEIDQPEKLADSIAELKPSLVVLDVSDNDKYLINELERLKSTEASDYLVISNNQNKKSVQRLLSMGIKGIVTKNCSEEEITNAMRSVVLGNRFFCNNVLDLVVGNEDADDCDPTSLTPREYEVLKLITKGFKTNQIADELHVSVHTINSHRKNILKKLNLKSPAELIVYALESGLVKS